MSFCNRKNFFLVLCALLICAFSASAGFAEDVVIDLTGKVNTAQYDISNSGDVRVTGSYSNSEARYSTLVYGSGFRNTLTLDEVNIKEDGSNGSGDALLFKFGGGSAGIAMVKLELSGDNTITATQMVPIAISNTWSDSEQNELIISGTGRLTITGGPSSPSRMIPAIGPTYSGGTRTGTAGSITIKGGYVVATGHNAPAIGDYTNSTGSETYGQRIKISGGVIEAKTNSADIPAIGMRWDNDWLPTYIIGGSVSADYIADPRNGNEIELSRFDVDYGVANAGKSYTFTVNDDPASYDYTFTVPDDGIAWLWVPEANSGDIPPVPAVNAPKLSIVNWYGDVNLLLDMSGVTAEEYKWFRATSAKGPFEEIATTAVPNYTDKKANLVMGTEYWYYAEADGVRSDTKSITPQSSNSSSNCNAGFGLLALLGLLAPAGVILRKRG
ncbi:SYNERG-CTERM sorting domain-containing protein [Synergistaceae bacterium OttesenSCG-928-D05]|nr:SYNERG-CTERM sorting domain-containing protein [Synergistaceae bacterium OttesenSCG-928-D05]